MKWFGMIALLVLLVSCTPAPEPTPRVEGTPVDIVKMYYAGWSNQDYEAMYALVSDGWKELEPTARTLGRFERHMSGFFAKAEGIRSTFVSEQSNTGSEAVVSVAIEVETFDGRFLNTNQTLALKLKDNGWKLINPYGEYTDVS